MLNNIVASNTSNALHAGNKPADIVIANTDSPVRSGVDGTTPQALPWERISESGHSRQLAFLSSAAPSAFRFNHLNDVSVLPQAGNSGLFDIPEIIRPLYFIRFSLDNVSRWFSMRPLVDTLSNCMWANQTSF